MDVKDMMMVDYFVSNSTIEGLGCFCTKPVLQGTLLWKRHEKFDVSLTRDELEQLPPQLKKEMDKYSYFENSIGKLVYCSDAGKYWNHSDSPNTFDTEEGTFAAKDISAGEELTCNYNTYK